MSSLACVEAPKKIPEGIKDKVIVDPNPFEPGFTGETHSFPLGDPLGEGSRLLLTIYPARTIKKQTYNEEGVLITEPPVDLSYRATTMFERAVTQKIPDRLYTPSEAFDTVAKKIKAAAKTLGPITYCFCETDPMIRKSAQKVFNWTEDEILDDGMTLAAKRIFEYSNPVKNALIYQNLLPYPLKENAA